MAIQEQGARLKAQLEEERRVRAEVEARVREEESLLMEERRRRQEVAHWRIPFKTFIITSDHNSTTPALLITTTPP